MSRRFTDDRNPLVKSSEKPGNADTLYYGSGQSPKARLMQVLFGTLVVIMVMVTIGLSIYRGITLEEYGVLYFMLGLSLIGFVVIEIILIIFIRKGELPEGKTWFLYFVGGCVILESIFTDVLLFD